MEAKTPDISRLTHAPPSPFTLRTFAIDGPTTEFRDDAVSIRAPIGAESTCILAVHIADVSAVVPQGSLLDTVARLRLQSLYASSSPLHMLPPALLHRASLSEDSPNECLTALITLDSAGKVRGHELVRSVIGPVRALSYDEVDEVLRGSDGMDSMVHRDLRKLDLVARRRAGAALRGLQLRAGKSLSGGALGGT